MTFAERVVATWYAPRVTPLAALLWPLSLLFRCGVAMRRTLFRAGLWRTEWLPVPVVVIGNVTVGGTGKTPLTRALADRLAAAGLHPGIVSRGHGGSAAAPRAVVAGDPADVVGDEPLLYAASGYPTWIGRDRVAAARGLLAAHPECDVLLADDGLQHYRLGRDVEIVAIDAARGFGNGLMLPAGPLREPAARANEADAVVRLRAAAGVPARGADGRDTDMTHVALPWRNVVDPAAVADPAAWRGPGVHAIAGIGHPERFFALLRAQGIAATPHPRPDHHAFTAADLAIPGATAILMTQKDAVKCGGLADARCWYLPIEAALDPALVALVENKVRGFQTARNARLPGHQGTARP